MARCTCANGNTLQAFGAPTEGSYQEHADLDKSPLTHRDSKSRPTARPLRTNSRAQMGLACTITWVLGFSSTAVRLALLRCETNPYTLVSHGRQLVVPRWYHTMRALAALGAAGAQDWGTGQGGGRTTERHGAVFPLLDLLRKTEHVNQISCWIDPAAIASPMYLLEWQAKIFSVVVLVAVGQYKNLPGSRLIHPFVPRVHTTPSQPVHPSIFSPACMPTSPRFLNGQKTDLCRRVLHFPLIKDLLWLSKLGSHVGVGRNISDGMQSHVQHAESRRESGHYFRLRPVRAVKNHASRSRTGMW
ncbi:hypothetical protein BKA56DRAFT_720588 [Ilyonectria sp. MPI-CAGE-AT-0026]|nr:hypothetical protein BKA56DRAFT_720588 [Ilyonectria sp. MPI-CAGE-AT-0026]